MPEEDRAAIPLALADTARALDLTLKLPKVTPGRAISFAEVADAAGLCPLCVREREIGRGDWDYPVGELPKGGASIRFRDLHYSCSNVGCPARHAQDGLAPAEWIAPLAGERALAVLEHLHEHWHESEGEMTLHVVRLDGSPVISESEPGIVAAPDPLRVPPRRLPLDAILAPPLETFVLGDMLPLGKSSVLFGPSHIGKSIFLSQLACAFAEGQDSLWGLDLLAGGGPVLVYTAEDTFEDWIRKVGAFARAGLIDPTVVQQRLWVIHQDNGLARLHLPGERTIDGARVKTVENTVTQNWIIQCAQDLGAKLVIIETASRLVDDEDNASFSALQGALGRIATLSGAAVLTSHHPNKEATKDNDSSVESARGGSSFTANARNVLSFFRLSKDRAAKEYSDFDPKNVLVLKHGKSTSSVEQQPETVLIKCNPGGRLGGVLKLPEEASVTPEMREEGRRRAETTAAQRRDAIIGLYDRIAALRQQDGKEGKVDNTVTYTRLRANLVGTGVAKSDLKEIIEIGRREGYFTATDKHGPGGGKNIVLGRDPRAGIPPLE